MPNATPVALAAPADYINTCGVRPDYPVHYDARIEDKTTGETAARAKPIVERGSVRKAGRWATTVRQRYNADAVVKVIARSQRVQHLVPEPRR